MSDGDFVERLDKLSNLKKKGIINEAEYEAQVNQIKKQYLNNNHSTYKKNYINNSTSDSINSLAALLLIVAFIIGGIWLFSSGIFDSVIDAGKDLVAIFEDDSTSQNDYDSFSSGSLSSGNSSSGNSSSGNSSSGSSSSGSLNSDNSNFGTSIDSTPATTESKSSYMASCKDYTSEYENMQRTPNSYKGLRMKFLGDVRQRWSRNGSTSAFILNLRGNDATYIGEIYCEIDESVLNGGNLLDWDQITVYGEFEGLTENLYNIYGYADYPSLNIKYIEFTSFSDI